MSETWANVPGYDGRYQVSDMGSVRSFARTAAGRTMKPHVLESGHLNVCLYDGNGGCEVVGVHRLVLLTFVGPQPDGMEGCHADDVPMNNALGNLSWGTRSKNLLDRVANGRHHQASKSHCPAGHEYAGTNVYRYRGKRHCRACRQARDAARRVRVAV